MTRTERIRATINGELDRLASSIDADEYLQSLTIRVKMNSAAWPRLIEIERGQRRDFTDVRYAFDKETSATT